MFQRHVETEQCGDALGRLELLDCSGVRVGHDRPAEADLLGACLEERRALDVTGELLARAKHKSADGGEVQRSVAFADKAFDGAVIDTSAEEFLHELNTLHELVVSRLLARHAVMQRPGAVLVKIDSWRTVRSAGGFDVGRRPPDSVSHRTGERPEPGGRGHDGGPGGVPALGGV